MRVLHMRGAAKTCNIASFRVRSVYSLASNKYVGSPYCRNEMYAGCVACCPLVSHGDYADGTDRQTDGRHYITLSARRGQRNNNNNNNNLMYNAQCGGNIEPKARC